MKKLDVASYRRVNESLCRRMVYHVGVDCGFFVEMNYMINAMLYCLAHNIRFQIYSDDANFGTGVGWTEYFLPFWIAVGTGTWGIAAVIPKYLSLRLQPERFVPLYPRKLAFTINLMLKTTKTS